MLALCQHPQSTTGQGGLSPSTKPKHCVASLRTVNCHLQTANARLLEEVEAVKAELQGLTSEADQARWVLLSVKA